MGTESLCSGLPHPEATEVGALPHSRAAGGLKRAGLTTMLGEG